MNNFIKANLISYRRINVLFFTSFVLSSNLEFLLLKNDKFAYKPKIVKKVSSNEVYIYTLELTEDYDFAKRHSLYVKGFGVFPISTYDATSFEGFDSRFYYDGDDLGSNYHKDYTDFCVWAPTSPTVTLKIENENDFFDLVSMNRSDNGVFRLRLNGDYLNKKYHYVVENSGLIRETNDPYGKAVSLGSSYSVVVDLNELNSIQKVTPSLKIKKPVDSIIYEVSVRDFTENSKTNIENKGKYLGFIEENRTTKGGNPAGLDYLKYLGVTHVQLLPIIDFDGVNELDKTTYNWGYNPISFFALEGSYSADPKDPFLRLKEVKKVVSELHKNNIRVILDVVYNHIYDFQYSSFEATVPNYFFRRRKDSQLSECSGCGDDFASERKMARKMIVDSIKYLMNTFDVDGFRFDLMGLMDSDTMNNIILEAHKIKDDVLLYGEGWNMTNEIPHSLKVVTETAKNFPQLGFFNDAYRDLMKGATFNLSEKGFICGNVDYRFGFDYAFHGSCLSHSYDARFLNASQSINYLECHDNNTLFDKLMISNKEETEQIIKQRVVLANCLNLLSFGVPFFHMGQEIGLSKFGADNTYNVPKINNMIWERVDQNFNMVEIFKKTIEVRKKYLPYLKEDNPEIIKDIFTFDTWDNGIVCLQCKNEKFLHPDIKELLILINVTNQKLDFSLDDFYTFSIIKSSTNMSIQHGSIPPAFMFLLVKRK